MKVCPVCEMEEEDSALSCSMCGSDFEPSVDEAPQQESPADVSEEISSDIAEMGLNDVEKTEPESEKKDELSEEEKLLEETLSAIETGASEEKSESSFGKFTEQFPDMGKIFGDLNKRLDRIFLSKGELNYIAPLTIVVISILLLSGVIGLAVSSVPGTDQESSDGYKPTTPYNKEINGISVLIGRGVAEPFSGEPFNCEIWDSQVYEEFQEVNDEGYYIQLTDRNGNGTVDDEERYGCPVNMKFISTFSFIILNLLLLTAAFYIYNKVSNTAIIIPVIGFAVVETILFAIYGGLLNNVILHYL